MPGLLPGLSSKSRRRKRDRRPEGERGAVAVEAALIMPVLCLIVFGMIDFSLLLRDYVSVTGATRAGVRIASTGADAGDCDSSDGAGGTDATKCPATAPKTVPDLAQNAADAVQRSLTGVGGDTVTSMMVFEANKNGYPCTTVANCPSETAVPTTLANGCTGYVNCVMFSWNTTKKAFRYSSGTWDSSQISACVNQTDSVGVYLAARHDMITGFFGKSYPINDRGVSKFEPLAASTCQSGKHQ